MSKLSAIHKQIAALQAEAERITKQEMSAAVAKVKGLMSDFGLTIEHLTQSVVGKSAAKKSKSKAVKSSKSKAVRMAKYADPKTGKTWTGIGRAPAWIAGAKNRNDFLVGAVAANKPAAAKRAAATKVTAAATKRVKAKATTAAKPATKKSVASKAAGGKKPTSKAAASKKVVKAKPVAKKASPRKLPATAAAAAEVEATATNA